MENKIEDLEILRKYTLTIVFFIVRNAMVFNIRVYTIVRIVTSISYVNFKADVSSI